MCISQSQPELAAVAQAIRSLPVEATFSMPTALEVGPQGVDKGNGLQRLCYELGLDPSSVYAAGDGENDLALLSQARVSFAPTHAMELVKQRVFTILEVRKQGLLQPMLDAGQGSCAEDGAGSQIR